MDGKMTYRQYLQYHANNHASDTKRKEAQALLNVVDDDGSINDNFLTGEKHGFLGLQNREKQSNGFVASTVNRTLNPWWTDSYERYSDQWDADEKAGLHSSSASANTNANSVYTPGNNLSYRDAQERANTIGQWEDELAYINSKLSNLDAARKTAQNTINDNFNIQDQRLDQQKAVADQRYNRHRNETKRSFMENRDANAAQSRDMYQSIMRLLGRGGAGSSSTANILAPHAIAQDSSKKNALIADTYRKDVEDIDEAANQAQVDYDNKKFDLSKWKKDQERDLNADTEAKRSDFLTKKAKAETNLGLARGDSWRRARSAANPTIAEREQVDPAISTLADSYRTPAPQKDLDVKDIERKNYVVDTAGVSVDQPEGEETSNANYYLDRMEEERRRKSKKLGITPALNNN